MKKKAYDFSGKTVSVLGLGISNLPLIEYLREHGAIITARDKKNENALGNITAKLKSENVKLICGENYLDGIDDEYIFKSPGIRFDLPQILSAVKSGSVLTSEMQLFFEICPAKIIGITGSDGKTTTTTLISKLLEAAGYNVYIGGNIGRPLLPLVENIKENDFAVVELSSFQLHTMTNSPDTAIITNLSPNHLDYHLGMEEYINAKTHIYANKKHGRLVLNYKNPITRGLAYAEYKDNPENNLVLFCTPDGDIIPEEPSQKWAESVTSPRSGKTFSTSTSNMDSNWYSPYQAVYTKNNVIYYGNEPILDCSDILIPGKHNIENYMAAIAAVFEYITDKNYKKIISEVAKSFPGVEHRIEFVRELGGVKYYNSSIDSSPTRTAAALNSFKQKLIVICGGYDKHIPFEPLAETLCSRAKCVILTGATADKINNAILHCPDFKQSGLNIIKESDFKAAIEAAKNSAQTGDTVILSPACASFDAFKNFEERGNRFKDIVRNW